MAEVRDRRGEVKNGRGGAGGGSTRGNSQKSGGSARSGGATRSGSTRSGSGSSAAQRGAGSRTGTSRNGGEVRNANAPSRRRSAQVRQEPVAEAPQIAPWRPIAALILSIAGFADAMYLTIEHFTGTSTLVCSSVLGGNCAKVTTSSESMVFGIFPVSLLGLIFFTAMIVINVPPMWKTSWRWVPWARLILAVGGMGFVLYLLYAELLEIKAICWWCTGVHVITFLLFVLIVSSVGSMFGSQLERPARA
jgi:uncharacterized membrane protein